MESTKKAQRAAILKLLRSEITPRDRETQSAALCERIRNRLGQFVRAVQHERQQSLRISSNNSTSGDTIHLCSFLPLYFEPNLVPIFNSAWEHNRNQLQCQQFLNEMNGSSTSESTTPSSEKAAAIGYRVYVPRMMEPSPASPSNDMHFVEVLNEADLASSFAPKGKYNIVELKDDVWESECVEPRRTLVAGTCLSGTERKGKRGVLGYIPPAAPEFADCFVPYPTSTLDSTREDATCHRHHLIVLCPSSAFDADCGRIGKGAGYYDRFLSHAQQHCTPLCGQQATSPSLSPSAPSSSLGLRPPSLLMLGVGFDEQLIPKVEMDPTHDVFMDEVLTPSHHYVRRGRVGEDNV